MPVFFFLLPPLALRVKQPKLQLFHSKLNVLEQFAVCGDDISFGWEIKAKRRGYEYNRFKPYRDRAVQDNALEKQERREENAVPS